MFGYATDETEECMPLTVVLAHAMNRKISDLRWKSDPGHNVGITDGSSVFTCSFFISFYSDVTAHCGGLGQTPRPRSPASTTSRMELASPPGIIRRSSWNYFGFICLQGPHCCRLHPALWEGHPGGSEEGHHGEGCAGHHPQAVHYPRDQVPHQPLRQLCDRR